MNLVWNGLNEKEHEDIDQTEEGTGIGEGSLSELTDTLEKIRKQSERIERKLMNLEGQEVFSYLHF